MSDEQAGQEKRMAGMRTAAVTWIASADAKAMGVLTVGGGLLAILAGVVAAASAWAPGGPALSFLGRCEWAFFLGFCACSVVAILVAAWALYPRTNRKRILRNAGWATPLARSRTFFGDIAQMRMQEFVDLTKAPEDDDDLRDAQEQTFILQRVAARKMLAIRISILALALSLVALAGMLGSAVAHAF
jgi:hypothetical protein